MNQYTFIPQGVCSKRVDLDIDAEGRVHNIEFLGGCNGNLKAIASLCEGMQAEEVVKRLQGVTCGFKPTSCGDQFARNLAKVLKEA